MNKVLQCVRTIVFNRIVLTILLLSFPALSGAQTSSVVGRELDSYEIKAFCVDFNWSGSGRRKSFAKPGIYARADPKALVEWHKEIGTNVIQTFCVSHNGYAWYKNKVTPQQPGLKSDFLREVVKLGHASGMQVMGYFSIAANTRWGQENPKLSYGTPSTYHLPYTDQYLAYLDEAIRDAVENTGIDGFMVDWIWQPKRTATKGKWIEAEKLLYQQLMNETFPGEDRLTKKQDLEYSRKALARCWSTIYKAAKESNPKCIVWLTCNTLNHPHIANSEMLKQIDWLMAEAGGVKGLKALKPMVGKHTKLLTCLAAWNGKDPHDVIPEAMAEKVGLYGFRGPTNSGQGSIPLSKFMHKPLASLSGDDRNIAAMARIFNGHSFQSEWKNGKYTEPSIPHPFRLTVENRSRGSIDTMSQSFTEDGGTMLVSSPYGRGKVKIQLLADQWPATVRLQLRRAKAERLIADAVQVIRISNASSGCEIQFQESSAQIVLGSTKSLDVDRGWSNNFKADASAKPSPFTYSLSKGKEGHQVLTLDLPREMFAENPKTISLYYGAVKK